MVRTMTSVSRKYGTKNSPFAKSGPSRVSAPGAPVVLLVSGGADSSALLVMAATTPLDIEDGRGEARIGRERLHVLHVNHLARGIDATEDEEFVVELAGRYGIPVTVVRKDVMAMTSERPGHSFEEVAREVRYEAARELADRLSDEAGTRHGDARIVTAHTANDRAETFFMNALRGSGPSGLSSIPRRRNRVVRPLLDHTHQELCDYLRMHGIVWREDATNANLRYLRNYVRHELLPVAEAKNARLLSTLSTTCDLLSDEDAYLAGLAAKELREALVGTAEGARFLDAERIRAMDVALARRVVRQALLSVEPEARLEARHVRRVLEVVAEGSGSLTTPLGVDVAVEQGVLVIRARRAQRSFTASWLMVPGELELSQGLRITARYQSLATLADPVATARAFGLEYEGRAVMLDAAALGLDPRRSVGRLWIGPAEPGELVRPLGMRGRSKRISDLLADAAIPARERNTVPVVRQKPGGEVLWVCGVRADERAKVTSHTETLVVLKLVGSALWLKT